MPTDNENGYCMLAEKCRCKNVAVTACSQWVPRQQKPPMVYEGAPQFEDHPPYLGGTEARTFEAKELPPDIVVRPKHYDRFKIEPIYFSRTNDLSGNEMNFVKYGLRAPYKHPDIRIDYKKCIRSIIMEAKYRLGDPNWAEAYVSDIEACLDKELAYDATPTR